MNSGKSKSTNEYFPALTGVRALAAFLVYLHHFNPIHHGYLALNRFFYEFYVGVTFFFVLSGLLITLRYSDKKIDFRRYIVNRTARIYPMWFILTIITFLVSFTFNTEWFKLLFLNLTFLKGFSDQYKFTGIDQGWSLTVEECFYFLAPVLIFLMAKKRWVIFPLTLAFIAAGAGLHLIFNAVSFPAFENFNFIFLYTIFGRSWEFLIGVLAALIYKEHREKIKTIYSRIFGVNTLILICIGIIIYALFYFEEPWKYGNESVTGKALNNFVLPVFIVLFYLGLMVKKDLWHKIFSSRPLVFGGKISYVFYLIHLGFFHKYLSDLLDFSGVMRFRKVTEFTILVLLSAAMYHFIEEPLNKKVKNLFRNKT